MKGVKNKISFGTIFKGDRALWAILIFLGLFSILVIYSSAASMAYRNNDGNTSVYLIRQIRFVLLGFGFAYAVHLIDYKYYFKYAKHIFIFALALMLLIFLPSGSGATYNDATRWVQIKYIGVTFQPSDVLKIALVIILAKALAIRQRRIDRLDILPSLSVFDYSGVAKDRNLAILEHTTIPVLGPVCLSALLVMGNSLSTALIVLFTCFIILLIGRVRTKELCRLVMFGFMLLIGAFLVMKALGTGRTKTWENRIAAFVSSDDRMDEKQLRHYRDSLNGTQEHQAIIAVASGWLTGKGPGKSTQRSNLPHSYSDFAYAFIIEEYGIAGALIVLGCYLWIFYRSIVIFRRCDTPFASLLVLGLSLFITLQAFLHMCVSVGIAPVTGQTLPLISLGGSSLVFTCISFGIILSVSRREDEKKRLLRLEQERKLVVEQWDHVLVEEDKIKKVENMKSHEVIWKRKYKDNR